MANRFYAISRGQVQTDVAEGSSTNSKDVEVNVDLSKSLTEAEVLQALEYIMNYIIAKSKWPPA